MAGPAVREVLHHIPKRGGGFHLYIEKRPVTRAFRLCLSAEELDGACARLVAGEALGAVAKQLGLQPKRLQNLLFEHLLGRAREEKNGAEAPSP